jgi:hypothetical protein
VSGVTRDGVLRRERQAVVHQTVASPECHRGAVRIWFAVDAASGVG